MKFFRSYDPYTGLQLASQERPLFYFRTLFCGSAVCSLKDIVGVSAPCEPPRLRDEVLLLHLDENGVRRSK